MPTVAFTETEAEYVREICRLTNSTSWVADIAAKLAGLNDGQASAARRDIAQWQAIEYGTTKTRGGLRGADYDTDRDRLLITNRMRMRLAYPPLGDTLSRDAIYGFRMSIPGSFEYTDD